MDTPHTLVFHDIHPQAPVHVLAIPKGAYVTLDHFAAEASAEELVDFHRTVAKVCAILGVARAGAVTAPSPMPGAHGMQEVPHYHLHILGGRTLGRLVERVKAQASGRGPGGCHLDMGHLNGGCHAIAFTPIPTDVVRHYQAGGPDANGQVPERAVSDGDGNPCRHCLKMMPEGAGMLILAHRPFPAPQPYAELGPIFLCADARATRRSRAEALPEILASPDYIVRGYSGRMTGSSMAPAGWCATDRIAARPAALLEDARVAYVHVRSARNNCYQCRIDR